MPKHIVVCSDGTGNTAIKGRGTNVFKLFEAVDLNGHRKDIRLIPQVAIYDDGVGTQDFKPLKIFAGATGYGLARNVRQLYKELVRFYDPGDQIFLFGFSRGAFTVRTLAGMINACGILDPSKLHTTRELNTAVSTAYKVYRQRYHTRLAKLLGFGKNEALIKRFEAKYARHTPEFPVKFMGVWDTVDAVGTPFHISDIINATIHRFKFPDPVLNPAVEHACHALAIDEERHSFRPVLWEDHPRIEQVWFAGVHSNVGGGYPKQGVSLVALDWMLQKAHEKGGLRLLANDRAACREHANVDDKLYDSRAGLGIFYRWLPRDMEQLCKEKSVHPLIHVSALERIAHGTDDYAPGNLAPNATVVFTPTGDNKFDAALRTRAQQVEQEFHLAFEKKTPLLVDVKTAIFFGHVSYYVYVLSCVAVVLAASVPHGTGSRLDPWVVLKNAGSMIASAASLQFGPAWLGLKRLMTTPELLGTLAAGFGLSYGLWLAAHRRMSFVFSRFWHPRQPKLRAALKSARKAAAASAAAGGIG
jgi:hypothetical protein